MSARKVALSTLVEIYMFVIFGQANYGGAFQQERKNKIYQVLFIPNCSSCYICSSGLFLAALLYNIFSFFNFLRRTDIQYLYAWVWHYYTLLLNDTVLSRVSVLLSMLPRWDNHISPSGNGLILLKIFLVPIIFILFFKSGVAQTFTSEL